MDSSTSVFYAAAGLPALVSTGITFLYFFLKACSSQGPFFYQEGGKTYASLPLGMIQDIQKSPLFEKMQKDCKAEGIKLPKNIMAKDPRSHVLTPQKYLQNMEAGTMPPMNNHNVLKEMAEKVTANDQTRFLMMEFQDFKRPSLPKTPGPQKCK